MYVLSLPTKKVLNLEANYHGITPNLSRDDLGVVVGATHHAGYKGGLAAKDVRFSGAKHRVANGIKQLESRKRRVPASGVV